jgi:hypothetical protein
MQMSLFWVETERSKNVVNDSHITKFLLILSSLFIIMNMCSI